MKRIVSLLLCLVMVFAAMSVLAEDKPETLTFLHTWGAETHPNKPMVDSVVAYTEEAMGIKLEQESLGASDLRTKVATLYAANEGHDIVRYWSAGNMKPYAESGKLLNLDPYLDEAFLAKIKTGALDNYTFNGHVYGLPMGQSSYQLFVNKAMFDEAGLELPTDWEKLMTAVKYFKEKGMTPFANSYKYENASIAAYIIWQMMMNSAGSEAYNKAVLGEIDFASNPAFKAAVEKYIELVNAGAFSESSLMMDRDEIEVGVFNGTVPMYYCGTWVVQQFYMDGCTVNPDDIVIMSIPSWEGCADEKLTMSTYGDAFMVSAATKYPDYAAETLKVLASRFGLEVYERGQSASAYLLDDPDESNLSPLFIRLRQYLDTVTGCYPYNQILSNDALEEIGTLMESLQLGAIGADDFIAAIDELY